MTTQVFYRKYRPKTFSEFVGQTHVVKILTRAIQKNQISHALLFYGPRGTGKTTLARLFAKAINCEQRKSNEHEPCNQCFSCKSINEGKAIDIIEIDAASHRGIDEIRELREAVRFAPAKLKYKVYIIDEAHQLTKEAANALLKTLEEPPSQTIFILATTELHKMIPTIISRCQIFEFKKLSLDEIVSKLERISKEEKIEIEKDALKLIALEASGGLRDAEAILEQVSISFLNEKITKDKVEKLLGLILPKLSGEFLDLIIEKNLEGGFSFIKELSEKGVDFEEFLKNFLMYLHHILLFKILGDKERDYLTYFSEDEFEKFKKQAQQLTPEKLKIIIEAFIQAQNKLKYVPIPRLPLELAFVDLVEKI